MTHEDKAFVDIGVETPDGPHTITATADHRFYDATTRAWTAAKDLKAGEELETPTGQARIRTVDPYAARMRTYNLTVEKVHTYYVGAGATSVLVHNDDGKKCNHVVLGLAQPGKREVRSGRPEDMSDSGRRRPLWMTAVETAVKDEANTELSVTLEGLPDLDDAPGELRGRFLRAALRGPWAEKHGDEDRIKQRDEDGQGYGTAWEMLTIVRAVDAKQRSGLDHVLSSGQVDRKTHAGGQALCAGHRKRGREGVRASARAERGHGCARGDVHIHVALVIRPGPNMCGRLKCSVHTASSIRRLTAGISGPPTPGPSGSHTDERVRAT
ncbi:hypothetical protein GT354_02985 [Streptomyces sp. SID3343]|nr:hypothetical protein [Streptomyces sp. SID3343]